ELRVTGQRSPGPVRPAGDGGLTPASLTLRAGVGGGPEGGGFFFDCHRQESSTDRDEPPSTLEIDVSLEPFDPALSGDAGAPEAGAPSGNSALAPQRGLDAGRE
ncbi:MAG: hypothetical protein JWN04_5881, partial [Myxococcaceae bacterium]|nr:hypothetical protein [Myxococcaceae bacterium]